MGFADMAIPSSEEYLKNAVRMLRPKVWSCSHIVKLAGDNGMA